MRNQLFGYVLGALESHEHEEVEKALSSDARMCEELELVRKALSPLECDKDHHEPPLGLAASTCRRVAALRVERVQPAMHGSAGEVRARRTFYGWSLVDVAVAASILIAAGLLVIPAINHSRFNAQVARCSNNLQKIGHELTSYASRHADTYPAIPATGKLAAAGMYAPQLIQNGHFSPDDTRAFQCDVSDTACAESGRIPTMEELNKAAPEELPALLRRAGGSYAYTLGHCPPGLQDQPDKYQPTKRLARQNFVIMADAPCPKRGYRQSNNHGGIGQNVLYDDGHTGFVRSSRKMPDIPADLDFYHNAAGQIAAGTHPDDDVIGCSDASPRGK